MKSDKTTYVTYANLESLIYKIDRCPNNPEELQQQNTKPGEHIPCGHSMSTIWPFDNIENKHRLYRGKGCMKKFCISLREIVINFEKQKLLPLLEKELKLHQDSMLCYVCRKKFTKKLGKDKNYRKIRDHGHFTGKYRGIANSICNSRFNVSNEIYVVSQ